MMLLAGTAIRFKGQNSDSNAADLAESLRGHASHHGSKVVITKTTRLKIKLYPNGEHPAPNVIDLSTHRSNHE